MPGLLQVPEGEGFTSKLLYALFAEFLGTTIFSLFGSSTTLQGTTNSSLNNAVGNGLTLTVIVFITANISGAHINPAVTVAAFVTGYISLIKGIAYILCQIAGGIMGSLLLAGLVRPAAEVGSSALPSGCFAKAGIDQGQLFGWEAIMTFVLVMTVFSVAISEPNFGNVAPVGVGLALLVCVQAAGKFTGGSVNPARVLGPSIVFGCNWNTTWVYVLAELAGGLAAGYANLPLYGKGQHFMKAATDVVPPSPSDSNHPKDIPEGNNASPTDATLADHVRVTHTSEDLLTTRDVLIPIKGDK